MRRLAFTIDQLPAWAFVLGAIVAFGSARAGRLFALLHQNRGGMELGSIASFGIFLLLVIFAVRRRQSRAWKSTLQVMGSLVAGNAFAIVLIWPFIPGGYDLSLGLMLWDTVGAGVIMVLATFPLCILLLWASRRYGSHSAVTERRERVIRESWLRRFRRDQSGDDGTRG